jgi:hypothetical protein
MTAIKAAFADWRPVKSRGVLQLVLEVPVEQTKHVLDTLGAPIPGTEKWVGVALLVPPGASTSEPASTSQGESPSKAAGDVGASPQTKAHAAPGGTYAKRAGILCNDSRFMGWLGTPDTASAAAWLRSITGVASRREYDTDPAARQRFLDIETRYLRETGQFAEERR